MSFFNKYNKSQTYAYSDIKQIGNAVYSAGWLTENSTAYGLIIKVDLQGNLLWEKRYSSQGSFRKIIPCVNGDILLLGAYNGYYNLTRIKPDGSVAWKKSYPTQFNQIDAYITNLASDDGFYLVISDSQQGESYTTERYHNIFRLDGSGNISLQKRIAWSAGKIVLSSILTIGNNLLLAGTQHDDTYGRWGTFLLLDNNFTLVNNFGLRSTSLGNPSNLEINTAGYYNNELIINGHTRTNTNQIEGFITKTIIPNVPISTTISSKSTQGGFEVYDFDNDPSINNNFIYISFPTDNGSEPTTGLHKLSHNLDLIWTKKLNEGTNKAIISQVTDDSILFIGHDYGINASYFLSSLNLNWESCKTAETSPANFVNKTLYLDSGLVFNLANINFSPVNQSSSVSNLSPTLEEVCVFPHSGSGTNIGDNTALQSPNFYLQAAGSEGNDSTKGIHLRWAFRGTLGDKHLPKGDIPEVTSGINFNKANDFVTIYRARYQKVQFNLDLSQTPNTVNDNNAFWIYSFGNREFYVYFRNTTKYNQVRASIDPLTNTVSFFQAYGSELIEIENRTELFFAVELYATNTSINSVVQTESLSVSENTLLSPKVVSSRTSFPSSSSITSPTSNLGEMRLVCENGRSIRFKTYNCQIVGLSFEFYADFIRTMNQNAEWQNMGDYALTLNQSTAFNLLEPSPNTVHGKWLRYNNQEYVNVHNYENKWIPSTESNDKNIKDVIEDYITLSNDASNPSAIEQVSFEDGTDETIPISNLDLLNFAAYDYHIARMLGLGFLDVDSETFEGSYIYLASYITFGDLEDGLGAREVHHLGLSLPTSISDERLPLSVNIENITPGAFFGDGAEASSLTDEDGYTHNGIFRFVSLYTEAQPIDLIGTSFYQSNEEFFTGTYTNPVYAGIEYCKLPLGTSGDCTWEKPELTHDSNYSNVDALGVSTFSETRPLQLPENGRSLYVHKQDMSGTHHYSSYSINWFSRATQSTTTKTIETILKPSNPLLPPSNINPILIREEKPLLLTSQEEQDKLKTLLEANAINDKIFIRLTFDYHSYHELITRKVPLNSVLGNTELVEEPNTLFPDDEEVFAEEIDIFFRSQVPNNISGKALSVVDDPSNELLSIIETGDYYMASNDLTISPILTTGAEGNYVGGSFMIGEQQHIIHEVTLGSGGPIFKVYKKEVSDALVNDIPSIDADNLQAIELTNDGLFMAIENMQNMSSWGNPNPHSLKVQIGQEWSIHREVIAYANDDGTVEREVEKTRGVWWENTFVEKELEPVEDLDGDGNLQYDAEGNLITMDVHKGTYKLTFTGLQMLQHSQYPSSEDAVNTPSVEWFRGIVRIFTNNTAGSGSNPPTKTRKLLNVIKIENIGSTSDLVVYVEDPSFSDEADYDSIQVGNNISVNFYPGYKVYLYADDASGINETNILPQEGEGTKYSIFGLRSKDTGLHEYKSKISTPSLMFADEIIAPRIPQQPLGATYATRPDFFGRSTFTITTQYNHKPYGLLFYRANDETLLNALYEKSTILEIRASLKALGANNDIWLTDRWQNFLDFETLGNELGYQEFPPENTENYENAYRFPNPDKQALFDWANQVLESLGQTLITEAPGTLSVGDPKILGFIKGAIYNAFVPLTEVPIIYQHIKGGDYKPINKKQVIRDKNGYVLRPNHQDFEMAPMMKVIGTSPHETQFTDFNLDGTSNNLYFYGVKEVGSRMKMGDFSPFLGPIKLVNTNPPEAPEIRRMMPVLENTVLNTPPAIQLEINAYPEVQHIKKINIYRAYSKLDAKSIRTMQLAKVINIDEEGISDEAVWKVQDTFEDLSEVPYGEGLFYRVTVSRAVKYEDKDSVEVTEYAPSQASKIVATMMVESSNPSSPVLNYFSEPLDGSELHEITLHWNKTCYKGKYHLYKMNNQGNWIKIYEVSTNQEENYLQLKFTDLGSNSLTVRDSENNPIYHHFKMLAENTSGMLSTQENILSMYTEEQWQDIGGISSDGTDGMVVEGTFIIR